VPDSTEPDAPGASEESSRLPGWAATALKVLGIVLLGIALLVLQWFLRRRRILGKMHRGSSNAQVLARYREIRRMSKSLKKPVPDLLVSLAERACFSQHQASAEQLSQCNQYLRECTDALRKRNLLLRFVYRFVLALY
jgi:hypothetical protein